MTISRRRLIQVGALGGALSLGDYLRLNAADDTADSGRSAILVFLGGGPAHQDTFDMKPAAPAEYRGEFQPITTAVPGVQICEHMPRLAQRAEQYCIVRGITHSLADHGLGTRYLMTGNLPTPVVNYPMYGSVVSKEFPAPVELPSFVSIDRPVEGPGYLGAEYGPLSTGEKPRFGQPFRVRGITLDGTLTLEQFQNRQRLLNDLDHAFAGFEDLDDSVRSLDRFSEHAFQIISSQKSHANAFDLTQEPESEMDRFGRHEFGQSLLLANRLIEAGVRFVTVLLEGWDTHQDNFNSLGRTLLPQLDQSLAALFDRLGERGRLTDTAVLVTGEFGRTPKINKNSGRDHWARAMCSLMAGGQVRPGTVGATDETASGPLNHGFTPDDLAATFFRNIGIDPGKEYDANVGRPITLIRNGKPIRDVLS